MEHDTLHHFKDGFRNFQIHVFMASDGDNLFLFPFFALLFFFFIFFSLDFFHYRDARVMISCENFPLNTKNGVICILFNHKLPENTSKESVTDGEVL